MKKQKIGIRLCAKCEKEKKKEMSDEKKKFQSWSYGFSATVLKVVFILWAFAILFGAFVITYALLTTGMIEEPVNYMHEVNSTFGTAVIGVLITRVVGNVFEYNDGGIFGTSRKEKEDECSDSGVSADHYGDDDEFSGRSG